MLSSWPFPLRISANLKPLKVDASGNASYLGLNLMSQYSKERLTSFLFMASLATPMNVPAGINVPSNDVQSLRAFRVMSTELLRMNMSIMTNLNRMAYYFQCCSAAGILSENYRSCTSSASQLWSTHVFV